MDLEIRHIAEDEREELLRLRVYGFGNYPLQRINELDLNRMLPDELLGAYADGRLVATVHTYRLRQYVRGMERALGGIAGVAAYPEVRRGGAIRRLMQAALQEMHDEGVAVSMLRPFRISYYARFGYTTSDDTLKVTYPTRAFESRLHHADAKALRTERVTPADGWEEYVHLDAQAAGAAAVGYGGGSAYVHGVSGPAGAGGVGFHGALVYGSIRREMRDRRLQDFELVFFRRGGRAIGGAIFRKEGAEPDGVLHLESYRFVEPAGLAAVLRFAALHIDQCRQVVMNIAPGSPEGRLFLHTGDMDENLELRPVRRPWMVRIVDVEAALAGMPAPTEGSVDMAVTDEVCPWNTGVYRLSSDGVSLSVERLSTAPSPSDAPPSPSDTGTADLSLSIAELSALLYGSQTPLTEGGARAATANPEGWKLLQTWFPPRFLWNDWWF